MRAVSSDRAEMTGEMTDSLRPCRLRRRDSTEVSITAFDESNKRALVLTEVDDNYCT